ncbi:MAG: hypothetical protein HC835_03355 [Oscillatoriales cyanobacterium RM2_1_1]|nr:hypothetical protein [Oscillatoriales cyanobacterium SM2_3_0]NJO44730.1 hypothetical protein [Oscillatoriales cyanobacterium RM2_1_1]
MRSRFWFWLALEISSFIGLLGAVNPTTAQAPIRDLQQTEKVTISDQVKSVVGNI